MSNNILSAQELEDLTGYQWASKQRSKLDEFGIFYVTSKVNGHPKTTWYNVNNPKHLRVARAIEEEPNFSSMDISHG
jgi:hypothetical protein